MRTCSAPIALLLCVMAAMTCGCSGNHASLAGTSAGAIDRLESVELDGQERTYWLHMPASYTSTQPAPLLLVLHDDGGRARQMADITGFNRLSDAETILVVYPQGLDRHWNISGTAKDPGTDDVLFLSKLIDQLSVLMAVDHSRVYVVGFGTGTILAQRMGCERSDMVAGLATVAGSLPANMADKVTPTQPVAMLMIHGTADSVMPYAGGTVHRMSSPLLSAREMVDLWLIANGCSDRAPHVETVKTSGITHGPVRCERYSGCNRGTAVVLYTIEGGDHVWPGGMEIGPFGRVKPSQPSGFDAAAAIWNFFKMHPRM